MAEMELVAVTFKLKASGQSSFLYISRTHLNRSDINSKS